MSRQLSNRVLKYITSIFLLVYNYANVHAQSFEKLDSVHISFNQKFSVLASPLPIQSLNDSALKKLNSFSVADALRYFSGVQLKDYGGIGGLKTVDIRNMGSNHTGVLYNGIPLGNMQNGQVDFGKFSLDNIEEINLYNAGPNNLLQPATAFASGATITLQTRKPIFVDDERLHTKATFKTGSFGLINPSLLFQYKINAAFNVQASVENVVANGRYNFREKVENAYDTTANRENGDIHSWRSELGLFAKFKDSSQWQTQFYYYRSNRDLPGAVVNNRYNNPQRLWDKNFFAQSTYEKRWSALYRLSIQGKYAYDYTLYNDPSIVGEDGALNNIYRAKEFFVSIQNEFRLSSYWKSVISADYKYNQLDANLNDFAYPTRKSLLVVAATQYQTNRLIIQGNILGSFFYNKVEYGQKAADRKEYSPTMDFSWQPFVNNNFRIRGFYKSIFRMPTFNDLYYTSFGNIQLNPEFAKQYDLGFTYWKKINAKGSFISFQIDAFHNHIKDKIVAIPSQNLFIWKMMNLQKVISNGITGNFKNEWRWNTDLATNISVQYTYEKTLNKSEGNAYDFPVPYTPIQSGSAIVNISFKNWEANYSYIYTGSRYNITDITLAYSKLQPWYTHDINFVKKINIKKNTIKIIAEVNNFFNQQYEVILNYPMPGRNYRIGVSYNI